MRKCFLIGYPQGEKGYLLQRKSKEEIITCRIGDFLEDGREDKEEEDAEAEWVGRLEKFYATLFVRNLFFGHLVHF